MSEYINYNSLRIVEIDPAQIRRVEIVQLGSRTMGEWYAAQADKPKYMLNASLWDTKGSIGTIFLGGKLTRNEGNGFGLGTTDGTGFAFGKPWDTKWLDYITGYPALVIDGKQTGSAADSCIDNYVRYAITKRAAVAQKDGKLLLVTGEGLTLNQFRIVLDQYGAQHAINLDGGGSARLMIDGKAINNPTDDRACKLAIAVWVHEDNKEDKPVHKVFLGVGHGGADPGAEGGGLKEKDVNLGIALACQDELAKYGVLVKMSRTDDADDPLSEEIRECNAFDPDLALDIHINAGGGKGFEAFCTLSGGKGKTLAEAIEAEVRAMGQTSRGVKTRANSAGRDYYGFVRSTKCPAVIAEFGFIDNAADRAKFDEAAEMDAIGRAYARGILKTLGYHVAAEPTATDEAVAILRDKLQLADETIEYLLRYQYGEQLVQRIAEAVKGG